MGSALVAHAWFRSEPLSGFGGITADQLGREGPADYLHTHLDRVFAGGLAAPWQTLQSQGRVALYIALALLAAIREASPLGRPMEPTVPCGYAADPEAPVGKGVSWEELDGTDWEMRMLRGGEVPPQGLAERLIGRGAKRPR